MDLGGGGGGGGGGTGRLLEVRVRGREGFGVWGGDVCLVPETAGGRSEREGRKEGDQGLLEVRVGVGAG